MKKEKYIDLDGQELVKTTYNNGNIEYTNNQGHWHRLDGPAHISSSVIQAWFKNDLRHREDGPAYIDSDGTVEYWLNGKPVSKREIDLLWLKKQVGK